MKKFFTLLLLLGFVLSPAISYGAYATLDTTAHGNGTLSNGNLTWSTTQNSYQGAEANVHKTCGQWYYEITYTSGDTRINTGVVDSFYDAISGNNRIGDDAHGWGFIDISTEKNHNGTQSSYGSSVAAGDILGVAVDVDGGTIELFKNGSTMGVMFNTGLPSDVYFYTEINAFPSGSTSFTVNFGATAFTYTPPTGFVGLDDSVCMGGGGGGGSTATSTTSLNFETITGFTFVIDIVLLLGFVVLVFRLFFFRKRRAR